MPLMWIIDSAPFFLGVFASFAGRRQDDMSRSRPPGAPRSPPPPGSSSRGRRRCSPPSPPSAPTTTQTAAVGAGDHRHHAAARAHRRAGGAHRRDGGGHGRGQPALSEEAQRAMELSNAELLKLGEDVRSVAALAGGLESACARSSRWRRRGLPGHRSDRRLSRDAAEQLARHPAPAGFGVVVEEMKRQAEDTKAAAVQVKSILGEMGTAVAASLDRGSQWLMRAQRGAAVAGGRERTSRSSSRAEGVGPGRQGDRARRPAAGPRPRRDDEVDERDLLWRPRRRWRPPQRVADEAQFLNDMAHRLDRSVRSASTVTSADGHFPAGVRPRLRRRARACFLTRGPEDRGDAPAPTSEVRDAAFVGGERRLRLARPRLHGARRRVPGAPRLGARRRAARRGRGARIAASRSRRCSGPSCSGRGARSGRRSWRARSARAGAPSSSGEGGARGCSPSRRAAPARRHGVCDPSARLPVVMRPAEDEAP